MNSVLLVVPFATAADLWIGRRSPLLYVMCMKRLIGKNTKLWTIVLSYATFFWKATISKYGEGEGKVVVFSAKRWHHGSSLALIEFAILFGRRSANPIVLTHCVSACWERISVGAQDVTCIVVIVSFLVLKLIRILCDSSKSLLRMQSGALLEDLLRLKFYLLISPTKTLVMTLKC